MSGLEEVGIAGKEHLREALTTCSDPIAAMEDFQMQNGILLPSLAPALPFLDLHGIKRNEFHTSVMEELREKLINRIKELASSDEGNKLITLNDLLEKSFPVINVASLQPVVMSILQQLPTIRSEFLEQILDDRQLYKEAPIEVKQQIWQDNQALFADEVSPLLQKYIDEKESILFGIDSSRQQNFFTQTPKTRRQIEFVVSLTKMVGRNVRLYDMILQFLRTLFLRTRTVHYCTLRAEILMSLHDNEVHEICSVDPCHKFTWCLDACIREKFVDSKQARELQAFLDGIRRGQEQVLGDLSMILCDPFAIHTISISILRVLQSSITAETLPRNNEELHVLMRMLSLGLRAWQMIDSQQFKETKVEIPLVTRFIPSIVSVMIEDQIHQVVTKIPDEPSPQAAMVPEVIFVACRDNNVACMILIYYTLQVARAKDTLALTAILPILAQCNLEMVYQNTILHMLVSYLSSSLECFNNLEFTDILFDMFFMPAISKENVLRHFIRLIWNVHSRILTVKLTELLEKLQPTQLHSQAIHVAYNNLKEKIQSYQPSPTQELDSAESQIINMAIPSST